VARSAFRVLARAFFDQFFVSESGISDQQHRQALFGVFAFLVTPGLILALQLTGTFEMAYVRFPALVEPLTRMIATLFLTYGIVAIGVVAAFAWDALGFDRRDAMVIGPLPVSGAVVVGAKLAAMGALLVIAMAGISLLTAAPFALTASSHKSPVALVRHFVAHLTATTMAVAFVFSLLVTLRASAAMVRRGHAALESLLQCALVSALLCFLALTPGTLKITGARLGVRGTMHMMPIPAWSPTNWFLGIYEVVRGTNDGEFTRAAWTAAIVTLLAAAVAILTTIGSYRRQLRLALTPSTGRALRAARLPRAIARLLAGRDAVARTTADFILITIARNRAQQTPIAINAAIGLTFVVVTTTWFGGALAAFTRPRTLTLSIPLVLAFWTAIGLRASFHVPSELPAAWAFRANAPSRSRGYRRAVWASMVAALGLPAVFVAVLALLPTRDPLAIGRHALFVLLLVVLLVEMLAATIDFVPFTRPYRAGHSRLKTLWPFYAIGLYVFADAAARLEHWTWARDQGFLVLAACIVGAIALFETVARRTAMRWTVEWPDDISDDENRVIVLDLTAGATGAVGLP
jgi:hypothetical protein